MNSLGFVFSLLTVSAMALAMPQLGGGRNDAQATIVRDDRNINNDGSYQFMYETSNGIFRQEQGRENNGMEQSGGWSYTSPEGIPVEITFVSNAGGYQPVGALLPVAPPLPYQRTQVY
ncbi:Cuticle Protein CPR RR-1 [Hyalella azteca]|uniref:Cuticle Protein CPR RR-1 n=1 Tax=Hyalella azteca TaxID=294128 RepID=A0A6A0H7V7_HYAAZ|nr:larval cuticle protein LCP-22-like [Hyalella azteca]KAA0201830.1 Cuticle Protein CPR RR-1 [Hyalella azteca]